MQTLTRLTLALVGVAAFVYGLAWFTGFWTFLSLKPFPEWALEDFGYYAAAYERGITGGDPYEIREIGRAFLYPPQALLWVGLFEIIPGRSLQIVAYWVASVGLLTFIALRASRYAGGPIPNFALPAIGLFLPFWIGTYLGQVNIFVAALMLAFLVCLDRRPMLAGAFLAMAVALKVTPGLLLLLAFKRDWLRVFMGFLLMSLALVAATAALFGFDVFWTFLDVAAQLSSTEVYGGGKFRLSVVNILFLAAKSLGLDTDSVIEFQKVVWLAVLAVSFAALLGSGRKSDLRLPFAVLTLALTAGPNIVWLHHFTFLLPAICLIVANPPDTLSLFGLGIGVFGTQVAPQFGPDNYVSLIVQTCIWFAIFALLLSIFRQGRKRTDIL